MEDDDDQEGGPAITTRGSKGDADHDRVEQDTRLQNQDLPLLVRSGQMGVVVVSELEELRVDTRGLIGRSRRFLVLIPGAAKTDGSVRVVLGHVSVTEKVEQEGEESGSKSDSRRSGLV